MPISGLRDAEGFLDSQRPRNWRQGIILDDPNGEAPMYALTSLLSSKPTDDPEFNWHEKKKPTQRLALGSSLDANAGPDVITIVDEPTTIGSPELGNGLNCRVGTILLVEESGELLLVTTVTSATSITVTRGFGAVAATPVVFNGSGVNPYLTIIGSQTEEGADTPNAISFDPSRRWNNTQIFRNALNMTRTAKATKLRTGEGWKEAKREALDLHKTEIERALLWGARGAADRTQNGSPVRTTDGVVEVIRRLAPGNVITQPGGGTSLEKFEQDLEQIFRRGSNEKLAFCGNGVLLTLFQALRKNSQTPYTIMQGQKEFGMMVTRLVSPYGTIVFRTHPLMNLMISGVNTTAYAGMLYTAIVCDMNDFVWRPLTGSDTKYLKNRQGNGEDQSKDEYLTEAGLEIHNAEHHFLWEFGLGGGAAD